jgi:AcrR family transcriptional regulator
VVDPLDRVERLLDIYVGFAFRHPEIYRGAFLHVRQAKEIPPTPQSMDRLDFQRLLRDALAEGQANGRVRPGDPVVQAQALWAGVHGALALPIHMEAWAFVDLAQLVAQVRAMLTDGLRVTTSGIHKP